MTSRTIPTDFEANVNASHVTMLSLAEFQLDSGTLYLTDCPHDVEWNGITWASAYGVASIGDVAETADGAEGLSFTLSAVPDGLLATALDEPIQGRVCILRLATVTPGTGALAVDDNVWRGTLDTSAIRTSEEGVSTITFTAEHLLARWNLPNLLRHSHEDQQTLYPGDQFYSFAARLVEATIVWPEREYFYK